MPGTSRSLLTVEVVAEPTADAELSPRRHSHLTEVLWLPTQHIDRNERRLQRRARRQALALMILSSLVTILVLYGAWAMLQGLVGATG